MTNRTLRAAVLAAAMMLISTTAATAAPANTTRIDDVVDLSGVTLQGAGCTGGDVSYTTGIEHVVGSIRPSRTQLRASYDFTAVDSLTGETFQGAGSRHQLLRGAATLFHINLRLSGDQGSRIMLTGTLHFDASGQSGQMSHSLDCIHSAN